MKIAMVNYSDSDGGAARAAYRIHHALRQHGVDSTMFVNENIAGDCTVEGPTHKWEKYVNKVRPNLDGLLNKVLRTSNPILHSPGIIPSYWPVRLNNSDFDLVHLHWINWGMLSIGDIGRFCKPVVWTLHDMWPFCGAEHYTDDNRWREGYMSNNRPAHENGFDLNRWVWQRKRKYWKRPIHIVTPSRWGAKCVQQSVIMGDWPVSVVPNAIDIDLWQPVDKALARQLLHLPPEVPLLLFGALGGANDPRKGFDLLQSALDLLRGQILGLEVVIFGQLAPKKPFEIGFPIHYTGHLNDDTSMRLLYSAADVLVVPSRQETFGQTASESHACGTPVVAFDTCGLPDIVTHLQTGYLAKAFDVEDLAQGIQWLLADRKRHSELSLKARQDAVSRFAYPVVAEKYLRVCQEAIASF